MVGESDYEDEDDNENDHYHREIKMMTLRGFNRFQESVCRSAGTGCSGNSHLLFLIITMNGMIVMMVKMVMVMMMMI